MRNEMGDKIAMWIKSAAAAIGRCGGVPLGAVGCADNGADSACSDRLRYGRYMRGGKREA